MQLHVQTIMGLTLWLLASIEVSRGTSFNQKSLSVSQKLGREMSGILDQIQRQTLANRHNLRRNIIKANRRSFLAAFGYANAILLLINVQYYDQTFIDFPTFLDVAGLVIEDGGYDGEELQSLEPLNTRCIARLEPLVRIFNPENQFQALEEIQSQFPDQWHEDRKQHILRDLTDFQRIFQDQLACLLKGERIFAEEQRLLGLLGLYTKTAQLRLEQFP